MAEVDFENWPQKMNEVLTCMTEDKAFYVNTIAHTENYIQTYLIAQAQSLFEQAIDVLDENKKITDSERNFISRFFAYGICGIIIEWVLKGMQEPPEIVTANMRNMLISCARAAYLHIKEINF